MKNFSFISQEMNDIFLTLIFNENQDLIFIFTRSDFLDDVQKKFKKINLQPQISNQQTELIFQQLADYFQKKLTKFNFEYKLIGTNFQIKVWNELSKLEYGEIVSYSEIAQRINHPKAVRAVGTAIGMNPISIAIPCHRVNGKDNKLHGYRGGLELKQKLQNLELK